MLYNLNSGDFATIREINTGEVDIDSTAASLYQRLIALGFRVGKQIQVMRKASFHGPIHVRIGTTDVILRESEANLINISQ